MKNKQAVVIIKLLRVPTAATMVAFSTVSGVFVFQGWFCFRVIWLKMVCILI